MKGTAPAPGLWLKVDASRRRNDPRKAVEKTGRPPPIMVRLSVSPARSGGRGFAQAPDRRGVVVRLAHRANPPAGGCGGKDQVSWGGCRSLRGVSSGGRQDPISSLRKEYTRNRALAEPSGQVWEEKGPWPTQALCKSPYRAKTCR